MHSIVHIITGLSTGGAERALYNLLYGGLAEKFDCHVISLMDEGTYGEQIRELGVPVTTIGIRRGIPSPHAMSRLVKAVRKISPDIIQGWMYHGNLAAFLAQRLVGQDSLLFWNIRHSLYDLFYEKKGTRLVIKANAVFSRSPHAIIYNSRVSRRQHEKFGFYARQGKVIPNGIDGRPYTHSKEIRDSIRRRLGIPLDFFVTGHVARFHPMKDHRLFLRAAINLAEKHGKICFILCGRNVTWDNRELTFLVPENFKGRFLLLGERRDVADLFCAMDIAAASSYGEGFPNVIGEAMASSLPCVVTDVGDSAYIVGDTGIVVPPRDSNALAAGIEKMLLMPPERRQFLGRKARTRIISNFALASVVDRYSELYKEFLREKRG